MLFLVIVSICLINMLIAMMTETFSKNSAASFKNSAYAFAKLLLSAMPRNGSLVPFNAFALPWHVYRAGFSWMCTRCQRQRERRHCTRLRQMRPDPNVLQRIHAVQMDVLTNLESKEHFERTISRYCSIQEEDDPLSVDDVKELLEEAFFNHNRAETPAENSEISANRTSMRTTKRVPNTTQDTKRTFRIRPNLGRSEKPLPLPPTRMENIEAVMKGPYAETLNQFVAVLNGPNAEALQECVATLHGSNEKSPIMAGAEVVEKKIEDAVRSATHATAEAVRAFVPYCRKPDQDAPLSWPELRPAQQDRQQYEF